MYARARSARKAVRRDVRGDDAAATVRGEGGEGSAQTAGARNARHYV